MIAIIPLRLITNEYNLKIVRMDAYESRRRSEISVAALYCHFFLSVFAMIECLLRIMLHCLVGFIGFLGFYVLLCLSCGKAKIGPLLAYQGQLAGNYLFFLWGVLGNLVVPWAPPLFAFHRSTP